MSCSSMGVAWSRQVHTLLQIGDDRHLMASRGFVLQRTSLAVTSCHPPQAKDFLDSYFDVILLCHTVAHVNAEQIKRYVDRFWPVTAVVRIAAETDMPPGPGRLVAYFQRQGSPAALLDLVAGLLLSPLEKVRARASVTAIDSNPRLTTEIRSRFAVRQGQGSAAQIAAAP